MILYDERHTPHTLAGLRHAQYVAMGQLRWRFSRASSEIAAAEASRLTPGRAYLPSRCYHFYELTMMPLQPPASRAASRFRWPASMGQADDALFSAFWHYTATASQACTLSLNAAFMLPLRSFSADSHR